MTPTSFRDPFYADLSGKIEQKLALPSGLLRSIVLNGERSNADQVSEAGAKTVFQIIPPTRKAILEKYGLDAYLSAENAAEAAGLLLKEGLERNNGDVDLAVAEYHGGTNRNAWGPRTKAYVQRVSTGIAGDQEAALLADAAAWKAKKAEEVTQKTAAADDDTLLAAAKEWKAKQPQDRGIIGDIREAITGEERATEESEALPDWASMPELNELSMASAKTGLGTLMSGPEETAQIIQANFPNVQIRQDERGNLIFRSSMDGQEYAYKPGFRASDIPRAAGAIAAFTPAGRAASIPGAALASGATQAAIEGTQAATGGEAEAAPIVAATVLGAAVPAVGGLVREVASRGQQFLQTIKGAPSSATVPAAVPVAPVATPPPPLSGAELAQQARTAATGGIGSTRAKQVLAGETAPNPKTTAAAERLGITEFLQPDHVTTNQAFRELAQAVKSVPGSQLRASEKEGLEEIAKRADDLITEAGGSTDLSQVSARLNSHLSREHSALKSRANALYDDVRAAIPATSKAPATNVLEFIKQRAKDLGGNQNLSAAEKQILAKLGGKKQPTYALLDDVRRDINAARFSRQGAFKDSDDRLLDQLGTRLRQDQEAVATAAGVGEKWNLAQSTAAAYKGVQDDLTSLFGRTLDGSVVGDLSRAVGVLAKGDTSQLIGLLKSVPQDMRQEVVASGLNAAFGKTAKNGSLNFNSYARWYEGLLRNKKAYTALMSNLDRPSRKQLSDLYRVSKGISDATRERITTGRIQAVTQELQGADTLMGNLYSLAKRSAVGAAAEAITTPMGLPGAGISAGLASALTRGKPSVLKATDELISSPEFLALSKNPTRQNIRRVAYSKAFSKYAKAVGQPREMSDREKWILQAMQANNRQEAK